MNGTLAAWWQLRSEREQRLLFVMFGLIALVLIWLLVIRPLSDALDSVRSRHGDAVTALAEARARAATGARSPATSAASVPLPVDAFIGRTASEAGFTGARITAQGPARASIAIDAARPQAFFAWVRLLEQSGLAVETLQARANSDRTLAVEAALRARGR
jgi:general secretion pathway protein M